MKRENIILLSAVAFFIMILIALFTNNPVQDAAQDVLHEIKTADMWKQAAAVPGVNCPVPQQGTGQGYYSYQAQGGFQQVASPIMAGQDAPVLIKYMGVEAIQVAGGKVKITGVMGSSWADKAGLKPGDILLTFNTKEITSLKHLQDMLAKAPPEKDAKITYMHGIQKKKGTIFIGEGEMEGFLPIKQPK
ncbi:MAG: PDZ domain-containing protein [Candidatus Omnitrophica bacterium]|nr:PDZ domain-containing protein [Candidatus Omnitrophota bacterium]